MFLIKKYQLVSMRSSAELKESLARSLILPGSTNRMPGSFIGTHGESHFEFSRVYKWRNSCRPIFKGTFYSEVRFTKIVVIARPAIPALVVSYLFLFITISATVALLTSTGGIHKAVEISPILAMFAYFPAWAFYSEFEAFVASGKMVSRTKKRLSCFVFA
jgi:hypothetical protein